MLAVLLPLCGEPLSIGACAAEKPTNTRGSSHRSVTAISARLARLAELNMIRLLELTPLAAHSDGNRQLEGHRF
jgi:hypothetical protein